MQHHSCSLTLAASGPEQHDDAAVYNTGTFYDPHSPSLGAWLEVLPADVASQGLGVARLQQNNTGRIPGFITQGPLPIADLDVFRASIIKPPQQAVKATHRYQLSQQAPKVLLRSSLGVAAKCGSRPEEKGVAAPPPRAPCINSSCVSCKCLSGLALAAWMSRSVTALAAGAEGGAALYH